MARPLRVEYPGAFHHVAQAPVTPGAGRDPNNVGKRLAPGVEKFAQKM